MRRKSSTAIQQFVRLCDCGCGLPTKIATQTNRKHGHVAGQPHRFLMAHNLDRPVAGVKYSAGYRFIFVPWHPFAHKGYIQEHRWVMEQAIGRYLDRKEYVHHRNEIKDDNRLENLEIMDPSTHGHLHNAITRWCRNRDECVRCGRSDSRHASRGVCHRCDMNERHQRQRAA